MFRFSINISIHIGVIKEIADTRRQNYVTKITCFYDTNGEEIQCKDYCSSVLHQFEKAVAVL